MDIKTITKTIAGMNKEKELTARIEDFQEGIDEAKKASLKIAEAQVRANALTHDQFEVALQVVGADGKITKEEQNLLDTIRKGEDIDLFKKATPKEGLEPSVNSTINSLEQLVHTIGSPRVTKVQALRIAYDAAKVDGSICTQESQAINNLFFVK
jgi:tellurite resistance protein